MSIIGLPESYASLEYADEINTSSAWLSSSDEQKEAALQWARVYIEKTYRVMFDQSAPSNAVKTANSMLSEKQLITPLFSTASASQPERGLKSKRVKGGPAEVAKEYDTVRSNSWYDPFPEISSLLNLDGLCPINKGGAKSVAMLRR